MSTRDESDSADRPASDRLGAIQRAMNHMTPTMQRRLMVSGIVVALGLVGLALWIVPNVIPAAPLGASPRQSTAVPSTSPNAVTRVPAVVIDITATLAPPATLKPAATKAPTGTLLPTPTLAPTATSLPTATPTSLPVPDWRATGKLTSIEYINTIVIERERTKTGIGVVIPGQDRIVMQVVGNIHAGIDLNRIKPANVRINGKSIRMVLPHAEIISVELMPGASRIYEADQTLIFSDYQGLELEAMDEARQKLRENSAHNVKMLEMAETLARLQLTELLRSLGYEHIEIVFE